MPLSISENPASDQQSTTAVRVAGRTRGDRRATSPGELLVTIRREAEAFVLVLAGELDLASVPLLKRHLDDAEVSNGRLVVDLSGLEFLDSSGLHLLLSTQKQLRDHGQELFLRPGPRAVQRVFELTSTVSMFRFQD